MAASSFAEAETHLKADIDLVISDINSKGESLNGADFYVKHAALLARHRIGFVAMTGKLDQPAVETFTHLGVLVQDKPFGLTELKAAIKQYARRPLPENPNNS